MDKNRLLRAKFIDLVLPPRCPCCASIVNDQGAFCASCWSAMHFIAPPWCARCSEPLPFEGEDDMLCASCLGQMPLHDGISAVLAYDHISAQIALRLKYGGRIGLASMIAAHLVKFLPPDRDGYIIIPVPLHWTRLWRRGYNQAALIGDALARAGGMTFIPDLLKRVRRTPPLRKMTGKERTNMMKGAFAVHPKWANRLRGRKIIIVDDIYTSGATTNACIKLLKKSGISEVRIFCWARVLRGEAGVASGISTHAT